MKPLLRKQFSFFTLSVTVMIGLSLTHETMGQTFIEPPSAPVGGNSASWITTGATTERKLGSLSLGTTSAPASLCLNAVDAVDAAKCVSSWGQVINLSGGPFVALRTTGVSVPSAPTTYFDTPPANSGDLGAVAIQGTGTSQAISLITTANTGISASYGLFAGDGGSTSNYAAYFEGKVGVEATVVAPGTTVPGRLCLNGTSNYTTGATAGCVAAWGELVGGLVNYVRLQSTNPPTGDAGTAGVTKVGNFGTVVLGEAPAGVAAQTFCGDGMCSAHINENVSGDVNYCPIDCVAPLPPTLLSVLTPLTTNIRFIIKGQPQTPTGNYYLLLVRSSNPTFISDLKSEFVPQNGVIYTAGTTINGVKIAAFRTSANGTSIILTDSGLETDVTYYYRLYQANLFPIYNQTPLAIPAATSSECPDSLPPNQICV